MGNDEVATRWAACLSLRELAHLLRHMDAVHGLYYLLMHGWMAVGTSPAVMRIPSVIAMDVRRGADRDHRPAAHRVGLGRAVRRPDHGADPEHQLLRADRALLRHGVRVRPRLDAGPNAMRWKPRPAARSAAGAVAGRRWLAYGGLVTLGGYLNEMSLLVLAAHAVTVLLARYGRPVLLALGGRRGRGSGAGGAPGARQHRGARRPRLGQPARPDRPAAPGPGLLRRGGRGRRARRSSAPWSRCCRRPEHGGGGPARRRGPACEPGPPWWRSGGVSLPSVAAPLLVFPAAILLIESRLPAPAVRRPVRPVRRGGSGSAGRRRPVPDRAMAAASGPAGGCSVWVPGVVVCVCVLVLQLAPQHHVRTAGEPQIRLRRGVTLRGGERAAG